MRDLMNDVRAFHEKCGVPVASRPSVPNSDRVLLRMRLHDEEDDELDHEMWALERAEQDDPRATLAAAAKELVDSIVVRVGTALELGIPLDRVWAEVHASNMTKSSDHTRADGKVLKGPDYRPPDIHKAIWGSDDPPSVGGEGEADER